MTCEFPIPLKILWPLTCFAFAFGCCVGSYLNVVIYRLPLGMKTSEPKRSFCPHCKYQIPLWHNIPIFSWLILLGRCANCRARISPRYLFVELLTGVLFVAALWHVGFDWKVFAAWTFLALCVAGSYIDIDHQILPHEITWGGAAAGLVASALVPNLIVDGPWWHNLLHSLAAATLGYALIYLIIQLGKAAIGRLRMKFDQPEPWSITQPDGTEEPVFSINGDDTLWGDIFSRPADRLIISAPSVRFDDRSFENASLSFSDTHISITSPADPEPVSLSMESVKAITGTASAVDQPREAMGFGDANWMACVGAFLGWKAVIFTIFAGAIIGSVISLTMILFRRREWAANIPFGPYLAAGSIVWLFAGHRLLSWFITFSGHGPPTTIEM